MQKPTTLWKARRPVKSRNRIPIVPSTCTTLATGVTSHASSKFEHPALHLIYSCTKRSFQRHSQQRMQKQYMPSADHVPNWMINQAESNLKGHMWIDGIGYDFHCLEARFAYACALCQDVAARTKQGMLAFPCTRKLGKRSGKRRLSRSVVGWTVALGISNSMACKQVR